MKFLTQPAAVAFGLATLLTLPLTGPLISPLHIAIYHLHGSSFAIFLPVMILVGLLWLLCTCLLTFARKSLRAGTALWIVLALMLPWALLKISLVLLNWAMPHWFSLLFFFTCFLLSLTLIVFWKPSFQPIFDQAQTFTATLLGFASISGLVVLAQLGWFAWQARHLNSPLPMHCASKASTSAHGGTANPATHPRIIWIILDELSYRQVYEQRFPGLQLPAFDRLAQQSTLFTHVIPVGLMTEDVVPSLISGMHGDAIRASSNGRDLFLHIPARNLWWRFDPHRTVFQDAINRGYSPAIAGWYNPYCRILHEVLDRCFWTGHYPQSGGMVPDQSLAANLITPIQRVATATLRYFQWRRGDARDLLSAQEHIRDYRELFAAADVMLNDSSLDLLYLHMPVPHPEGIYNRQTGVLTTTAPSSYIDNLALADAYVAHLRSLLELRGEWDDSTILIMGDHSWRTRQIWAKSGEWTPEEQTASEDGQFDDRPAYLLKLPHQDRPAHIDAPFTAIRTRALLEALMDHRIQSPQDLRIWAAVQP